MKRIEVEVTGEVHAPAEAVYAILADYREHHPRILPAAYFSSLTVEEGGIGAGTIFCAEMNVFGSKSTLRMHVDAPEPGHVLTETTLDGALVTTFTVTPGKDTQRCTVTIATTQQAPDGFSGWLQGLTLPWVMRRIYREELAQLDRYAQA
jgi:hypothetical protein